MGTLFGKRAERFLSVLLSVTVIVWSLGLFALTATVASAATLNEGDIIRGPDGIKVYIINATGFKRHIFNPEVFNMYGHLKWSNIKAVDQTTVDSYKTSDIYRADGDQKVYQTADDGVKKWFDMTGDQFIAKGYTFDQVFVVNPKERDFYSTGAPITYSGSIVTTDKVTISLAMSNPVSGSVITGQSNAELAHFALTNGTSSEVKVTGIKLARTGVSTDTTLSNVYLFEGATRLTDAATVSSGYVNFVNTSGVITLAAGASKTVKVLSNIATGTFGQTVGVKVDSITTATTVTTEGTPSSNLMTVASASDLATVDFNTTTTPSSTGSTDPINDYAVWQNIVTVGQRAVNLNRLTLREIGSINYADINNFRLYVDGVMVGSAVANLDSNGYVTFDLSASPKKMETSSRTIKVLGDIIGGSSRTFSFSLRNTADMSISDTSYGVGILPTAASSTFSARTTGTITVNSGTLTITKKTDSATGTVVDGGSDVSLGSWEFKAAGEQVKVETLRITIASSDTNAGASKFRNGRLLIDGVQVGSTADIYEASNATATYTEYTVNFTVTPGTPRTLEAKADLVDNQGTDSVSDTDTLTVRLIAGSDLNNAQGLVSGTVLDAASSSSTASSTNSDNVAGNTLTVGVGSLVLAKYSAYASQSVVVPKTAYKIGHFTLTGSTTEATNLTQFSADFTGADAFTYVDLSSVYIKYGTNTTDSKSSLSAATSQTWAISKELASGASMDVEVYANIASSAFDTTNTADTMAVALTVSGTTVKSATTATGGATTGQTITATSGSIGSAVSGSTPLAQVVSANQTVTSAKYEWSAVSDNYTLSEVGVTVGSAAAGSAISSVILKNASGTALATRSLDTPSSAPLGVTFTGLSVPVTAGGTTTLTVDLVLNNVGSGAGSDQQNVATTLYTYKHTNSSGTTTTVYPSSQAGNTLYVYKSLPTLTVGTVSNTTIANNADMPVYTFTVKADSKGDIAIKQFKLNVAWTDGGTGDTLELDSFKVYEGSSDITSTAAIVDQSGTDLTAVGSVSSVLLGEADTQVVVAFTTEKNVAAGSETTFTVRATPRGFRVNGATDTASDSVSFSLPTDSSHNGTSIYLNAGTTVTEVAKLYTSAASGNASAVNANLIWTDKSASSHAAGTVGASSTGDWANGYLLKNLPLASVSLSK